MMSQEQQTESRISSADMGCAPYAHYRQLEQVGEGYSDEARAMNPAEPRAKETASSRSLSTPMSVIAVVDQHSFTRGCITKWLRTYDEDMEVISFSTAEECLQSSSALDLILFHGHESADDTNDARFATVGKLTEIAPVIVLASADNPELLIEAFESGVRGYIPTASTPIELLVEIIHLVRAGGTFVPPSGLYLHRTRRKDVPARAPLSTTTNQQFTPRQLAVLNQLTQGKANKIIAYELAMSESTVKVHVRNIMKKMKATNRTEVACRAQAFSDTLYSATKSDAK
jgi:DNA-binding NarL/FixJ family response regulator